MIILIVDAGLNYYFLRTVKQRLVNYHGLTKYAPLVSFNAKLMVISIAMDVSSESIFGWEGLIGLLYNHMADKLRSC